MDSNQMAGKSPQTRSGAAGWVMFVIAIVLVVGGMAALAGPGFITTLDGGSPDFNVLFATYFNDLDAARANGQIQAEGIYQNLKKKGEDAQAYVNAGERDKALNELNALINELNAQAGKQVAEPDAGILIADVQAIIDALNRPAETLEPETATAAEDVTATPLDITESVTVTSSPTPPPVTTTVTPGLPGGVFSVGGYTVGCSQTIVIVYFGSNTTSVRATVNLASNLGVMLAEAVAPPTNTGTATISMTYPQQPEGTRLIIAVGEWDGAKYINPATLQGFDCTDLPSIGIAPGPSPTFPLTLTPTFPSGPTPTFVYFPTMAPPVSPTGGGRVEYWSITSTFVSAQGCDSSISPVNAIMPGWLEFNPNNRLTALSIPDKRWEMFPQSNDPNAYSGSIVSWDVTQKIEYNLTVIFSSPNVLTARETHITTTANTGNVCRIDTNWAGSR